jgi:hypothetical protein
MLQGWLRAAGDQFVRHNGCEWRSAAGNIPYQTACSMVPSTIAQSAIACNGVMLPRSVTGGGCVSLYFDGVTNAGIFTHAAGTNLAYSANWLR